MPPMPGATVSVPCPPTRRMHGVACVHRRMCILTERVPFSPLPPPALFVVSRADGDTKNGMRNGQGKLTLKTRVGEDGEQVSPAFTYDGTWDADKIADYGE